MKNKQNEELTAQIVDYISNDELIPDIQNKSEQEIQELLFCKLLYKLPNFLAPGIFHSNDVAMEIVLQNFVKPFIKKQGQKTNDYPTFVLSHQSPLNIDFIIKKCESFEEIEESIKKVKEISKPENKNIICFIVDSSNDRNLNKIIKNDVNYNNLYQTDKINLQII